MPLKENVFIISKIFHQSDKLVLYNVFKQSIQNTTKYINTFCQVR